MKVIKNLVPSEKYGIKCPYTMKPTRIVVHNTANDAPAKNEIAYMIRNNYETSFHYAVDDVEAVQGIEENRNAWHSSDGGNGKGNREGIAIEICYSLSGGERFIKAEQNAVELIVDILKRYGWGVDRVTKHQDYTNKYCPHRTLDMGWDRFIKMIEGELNVSNTSTNSGNTSTNSGNTSTKPSKTVDELAREVIAGKWGNGADRKNRLTEAGYNYSEVQARVDEILAPAPAPAKKSVDEIAKEVIRGEWGNGADRKKRLTDAGYDYAEVQARVNEYFK